MIKEAKRSTAYLGPAVCYVGIPSAVHGLRHYDFARIRRNSLRNQSYLPDWHMHLWTHIYPRVSNLSIINWQISDYFWSQILRKIVKSGSHNLKRRVKK